ncbi:hypothetical protein CERSUDRAFT_124132 [Gelatoporia subvermispora B]|uniref:Uncharacterized protein n=1 Tax=Ceriporiopsis subvermispora (strain B) TaxID=914234 RepID=M2RFD7_CERS8|nr:hypothetical protein CERSUDRAFT_124132 [Gelatoporia subvermispora B]
MADGQVIINTDPSTGGSTTTDLIALDATPAASCLRLISIEVGGRRRAIAIAPRRDPIDSVLLIRVRRDDLVPVRVSSTITPSLRPTSHLLRGETRDLHEHKGKVCFVPGTHGDERTSGYNAPSKR